MKLSIILFILSISASKAFGAGACVYTDTSTSGRLTICVDNVANQNACEHLNGINHKFFPGQTCDALRKANKSNTSVSLDQPLNELLAASDHNEHVMANFTFNGVDEFTQSPFIGAKVFYKGSGLAKISRGEVEGQYNVNVVNIHIKPLSFEPGSTPSGLAHRLEEYFPSLKIPRSEMHGVLIVNNEHEAYLKLDQLREVMVRGKMGTIESIGTSEMSRQSSTFHYYGEGYTLHTLLLE